MPRRPRLSRSSGRSSGRASKPPGSQEDGGSSQPERMLLYKVVELSTVDEGSLEETVNHWVRRGWNLDGVQFAMRESSKRPSMAFVFFTRPGVAEAEVPRTPPPAPAAAEARVDERTWGMPGARESDPWRRLERLASEDEENEP